MSYSRRKPRRRRLSVSKKLMLSQSVRLKLNNQKVLKTVLEWINEYPEIMYLHTCKYKTNWIKKVQLTQPAFDLLIKKLSITHPSLAHEYKLRTAKKNILKKIQAEELER